jgi:hypothetical protein
VRMIPRGQAAKRARMEPQRVGSPPHFHLDTLDGICLVWSCQAIRAYGPFSRQIDSKESRSSVRPGVLRQRQLLAGVQPVPVPARGLTHRQGRRLLREPSIAGVTLARAQSDRRMTAYRIRAEQDGAVQPCLCSRSLWNQAFSRKRRCLSSFL